MIPPVGSQLASVFLAESRDIVLQKQAIPTRICVTFDPQNLCSQYNARRKETPSINESGDWEKRPDRDVE